MLFSREAIDRPRVVIVATVLVLVLAAIAAFTVPVQRTPGITKAVVLVAIPYPGASPEETEVEITRKVEDALDSLNNVDFVASNSMRGSSVTQVVFLDGITPKEARANVKHLVDEIRNELPAGREVQPRIMDIDFENTPIMLVNLSAPDGFDPRRLKQIAEEVEDELNTLPGVSNTQLFGGREREIHVNIHPDLAAEYGLTIADFHRTLADYHAELPGGQLDTGRYNAQVRSETKLRGVEDIREAVVSQQDGHLIHVRDVASVIDTYRRRQNVAQLDGQECASIIVNKEADINTLDAARKINAKVQEMQLRYPHIKFSTSRDTSQEIALMFRVLGSSFIFGAMLVLVILAWTMGLRVAIIVLTAIPISCAIALIFLFAFDVPVSNMVIFSYILVLGMVVDGAIIVAENIHRHIEMGEPPLEAAKNGIDEVSLPVIAADLTTVAAYLPMLLVPGIMGDFMSVMPKVVTVALLGSILVDHYLIPVLAAYWYSRQEHAATRAARARAAATADDEAETFLRPHGLFTRLYAAVLGFGLRHRWTVVLGSIGAVMLAYVTIQQIGFDFFPASDRGQFEVRYELPLGYSIEETVAAQDAIIEGLERLRSDGDLVNYVSAIGASEGLASRLETDPATGPEFATVMVELRSPLDRERHEDDIIKQLRDDIKPWPGMKISIEEVEEGPPGGFKVAVRLTGKNLEQLGNLGEKVVAQLKDMEGTIDHGSDYRRNNPEITIDPIPQVAGLFNATDAQVAQAVQTAILGDTRIQLNIDDEDVTLRLQVAPEYQQSKEDIERLMLTAADGSRATVGELAHIERGAGLYSINRYNRDRAVTAHCNILEPEKSPVRKTFLQTIRDLFKERPPRVSPDVIFAQLENEVMPELGFRLVSTIGEDVAAQQEDLGFFDRIRLGVLAATTPKTSSNAVFIGVPGSAAEGVRAEFTGENEERDKNFRYLLISMLIAVVLIFSILVLQFNSFRQTFLVLLAVPLSFVGVVAGHWILDFSFSLASFIGLVALTGIVVNDSIVMVDFTNRARRRGLAVKDAIMDAGINRLRPVLLTTVTTIGGLLPLLLNLSGGAEFWQPLTTAICFGLGFATMLTLLVVPVSYSYAYNWSDRWARRRAEREAAELEAAPVIEIGD
ncbi:MAG: AcrB/AcrD/AcrF family protein [Planctomycetota bacterium]|nr:MAG: AcrB/AcrD/AcrF family protein [Planctomycetota bacterium]REK43186.1 MAG: AcrB/AcrD/AcrF family protein [Planctomycetota bacterium]